MNGKCYCGAPKCIGTLFPRIIRDEQDSGDEGGNEGDEGAGGGGDDIEREGRGATGGDDMNTDT